MARDKTRLEIILKGLHRSVSGTHVSPTMQLPKESTPAKLEKPFNPARFVLGKIWTWPCVAFVFSAVLIALWSALVSRNSYIFACIVWSLAWSYLGAKSIWYAREELKDNPKNCRNVYWIIGVILVVLIGLHALWTYHNISNLDGVEVHVGLTLIARNDRDEPILVKQTGIYGTRLIKGHVLVEFTLDNLTQRPFRIKHIYLQRKNGFFGWHDLKRVEEQSDIYMPQPSLYQASKLQFTEPDISSLGALSSGSPNSAHAIFADEQPFSFSSATFRLKVGDSNDHYTMVYFSTDNNDKDVLGRTEMHMLMDFDISKIPIVGVQNK